MSSEFNCSETATSGHNRKDLSRKKEPTLTETSQKFSFHLCAGCRTERTSGPDGKDRFLFTILRKAKQSWMRLFIGA